jgi:conjugative relaxase-like TrwC/TraI family protein
MRVGGVPIVFVTPLGSTADGVGGAIDQIIDYLQRGAARRPEPNASLVGYYADTPTQPGVWRGRGVNAEQLLGPVDPEVFRRVLAGSHPQTGEQLVAAVGSAGRASREMVAAYDGPPDEYLDVDATAKRIGVNISYVKRLALETERNPETKSPLHGKRDEHGQWWFRRDEVERFAATRKEPKVVVAYDVTVSFEKSISLVWARSNPEQRRIIEKALDAGTNAAVAYLEDQALAVRRGRSAVKADGVWAASFRHITNRNLEPQLHDHVVIANIGAANGRTQALDSRLLHHHAKTAGYVAGAVTRQHLTDQLGIAWQSVERGLADIDGITRPMITAFSTRRTEITTLTDELGLDSAAARDIASLATRTRKHGPADWDSLEQQWSNQLDILGLSNDRWQELQQQPIDNLKLSERDQANVLRWLDSPSGVTKSNAVFSRRDVVQAIVEWDGTHGTGTRLAYNDIDRLTDSYLTQQNVVALDMTPAQITRTGETNWYSTAAMLDLERTVIAAYTHARSNHSIPPEMVAAAHHDWEHTTGHTLGDDQARMVAAITSSSNQFLPVVGPAGSGKTAALKVAATAWTTAGLQPIGASVTGAATEVLAEATGMPTRTVASLMAEIDNGGQPFNNKSVLIVDEASTLSNRDHHTLVQAIAEAGALMRTIGDPAQHRAVEAGGLWAHLVTDLADQIPVLETNRRQAAPEMTDVRLANADYRDGLINQALQRLHDNDRIVSAPTADELLDHLTADWYTDRQQDPETPSRMMAESHTVRRQLNHRAQTLLVADGTLTGPAVVLNGERFHVGDNVITRTQDRNLRHDDGHFLRNGSSGTIVAIDSKDGQHQITVEFNRHGPIVLPHEFLTRHIRAGLDGGLAPAYAITTHAAQGSTYRTGRMLTTDSSSKEGVYVGLTRGTSDTRLYLVANNELAPTDERSDIGLPIIRNERTALATLADHLNAPDQATVIAATDPDARIVHSLRTRTIEQLRELAPTDLAARRALQHVAEIAARHDVQQPSKELVERFGERPATDSPLRPAWDDVVSRTVMHEVTFANDTTSRLALRSSARVVASTSRFDTIQTAIRERDAEQPTFATLEVANLASKLRTARSTLPLDDALIGSLNQKLETHVSKAVESKPDYLGELLGDRPDGDEKEAIRWDTAAASVERFRHRQGVTPEHGSFEGDTAKQRALGTASASLSDMLNVDRALDQHNQPVRLQQRR